MAILDILAQTGDNQDFIVEIPTGNSSNVPNDILIKEEDVLMCVEIPTAKPPAGGNIFIMSE